MVIISLMGWLCFRSISHDAQIAAVQYQIQSIVQSQSNTIPPVVETSLREIREKTNAQVEMMTQIRIDVRDNQKDIVALKDKLPK